MNNFRFASINILSVIIILAIIINCGYSNSTSNEDDLFTVNITVNNYNTKKEDEYVYIQYELPDEELLIVGFLPLITMNSVHHILSFACSRPYTDQPYWTAGGACKGQQKIIHDWGRNAPLWTLPKDVGIAVGRNTPYKYIVVNLHYLSILKNDYSGTQLIMTRKPRKYHAAIALGGTHFIRLEPKTHRRVNSFYRVRDGEVSLIIKGDPKWSQAFYPLPSAFEIRNNDYIMGQCVYDNNDDRVITVGKTHTNEMCNVYAMYSYEPPKTASNGTIRDSPPIQTCWGNKVSEIARLIPPDSEIPPLKPIYIGGVDDVHHVHVEHTMNSFTANLYENVENWTDVQSLSAQLGEIGGIALNNANNELIVFHRGSRKWEFKYFSGNIFRNEDYGPIEDDVLVHIDTCTGKIKFRWGTKKFYMPNGLTIDHEGNFWLTDIAMHQVFMFKPNDLNHPALVVGEMFKSGSGRNQFCRPADVAVMKNGDFFVADGYCNSRIIKFNRKGEYLMEWGSSMSGKFDSDSSPLPNEWNIVHSLALNEDAQLLCGVDRENFRIQCFNSNTGVFQRQIHIEEKENICAIYAIEFAPNTKGTILFAVTGGEQTLNKKIYMINAQNGEILTSFESSSHLIAPQDITVSTNAREIYVSELVSSPNKPLHKFKSNKQENLRTQISNILIYFSDKNFRIFLIIMATTFVILVFASVIIGCIIRKKNKRKFHRLNASVNDVKNNDTSSGSIFSGWMNRRKRFEKLQQYLDDENEPLHIDIADDENDNSGDETITSIPKIQVTVLKKKKDTIKLKLDDSL
ncbi:unnamed protein product [Rotaria sp. Silwood1]|nr:unnamed protein product [Rotaria sp. Silwood1]